MKVFCTVFDLQKQIKGLNLSPVGFVPTMGALHEGHISLVKNACIECPLVIVSIYVNPTQFNDSEDLKNYPRTPEDDLNLLEKILRADDIVFTPGDREIYPAEDRRQFKFGNLDNVMEALHRPGHFNGVAQVVSRFFEIINPDIAWFGMKDFQQVAVIKELVRQNNYKVKIAGNPIIRENDGLAMSSRNRLLDPVLRKKAPLIFKILSSASAMGKTHDIAEIKNYVSETISKVEGFRLEYFEIADDKELIPLMTRNDIKAGSAYYGCIAVKVGSIRLIDNIEFPLV